jgi:hypothetical protein
MMLALSPERDWTSFVAPEVVRRSGYPLVIGFAQVNFRSLVRRNARNLPHEFGEKVEAPTVKIRGAVRFRLSLKVLLAKNAVVEPITVLDCF